MSVEIVAVPRETLPRSDVKGLGADETVTVAAGAASNPLPGGLYRLTAIGADFRVKAGPSVTDGASGTRLVSGLPEVFYIENQHKIGVSAV